MLGALHSFHFPQNETPHSPPLSSRPPPPPPPLRRRRTTTRTSTGLSSSTDRVIVVVVVVVAALRCVARTPLLRDASALPQHPLAHERPPPNERRSPFVVDHNNR
mmetsp:Transcript_17833/g.55907  ORF Transcript_17833/g.55907 Transcript_17833/m.55907 type:complete len:105 (+) Transcript_17833:1588-1902(+)